MTTCDNDHEPISFESPFAALCPLCALKREMAQALEAKDNEIRETEEYAEEEVNKAESAEQEAREALAKMEDERDGWKARAEELEKKLEGE